MSEITVGSQPVGEGEYYKAVFYRDGEVIIRTGVNESRCEIFQQSRLPNGEGPKLESVNTAKGLGLLATGICLHNCDSYKNCQGVKK